MIELHRLDGALEPWMSNLFATLLELYPLPPGTELGPEYALPSPRVVFAPSTGETASPVPRLEHHKAGILTKNARMTAPDWTQDVRHIVIEFADGLEWVKDCF